MNLISVLSVLVKFINSTENSSVRACMLCGRKAVRIHICENCYNNLISASQNRKNRISRKMKRNIVSNSINPTFCYICQKVKLIGKRDQLGLYCSYCNKSQA